MTAKEIVAEIPRYSMKNVRSKTVKVNMRDGLVLYGAFVELDGMFTSLKTNSWLFECGDITISLDGHNIKSLAPFDL